MTHLGYLVPDWPTQTHAFFWREVQALRASGCTVTLFSTRRPTPDACRHEFAAAARAETRYLHPPRLAPALSLPLRPGRLAAALGYWSRLSEAGGAERLRIAALLPAAADLAAQVRQLGIRHVHGHSCANSAHLLALASRIGGFDYSLTLHGDLDVYGVDHPAKMQGARFVAAVTAPLRDQVLAATGLPPARVPVIAMGVDGDVFAPASHPAVAGRLHLVTVARLNPLKGHDLVLTAIRRARDAGLDVRYSIAGEGPARDAIVAQVAALGLDDHVELLGSLGEGEVVALLRRADAFVLASFGLGEAAPVSVMEAMACGLPVICSRIGGTPDMIEHGVTGWLVDQRDVEGLADAVETLALDADRRAALAAAARRHALAAFDYRRMARRLLAAIVPDPAPAIRAARPAAGARLVA